MHTINHTLERLRASPRAHKVMRTTCRSLFYSTVAMASAIWAMAVMLACLSGSPSPVQVIGLFMSPGIVWLLVWSERRSDAKDELEWARKHGPGAAAGAPGGC